MYGVVFAYGFRFFDQASISIDYIRLFFRQAYELYRETSLVACLGGAIIGHCLGALTAPNRGKGWILSLAASSKYRRRGYGSRLLSEILEALLEMQCNEIILSVQPDNNIAKALFQKHAFKTIQFDSEYFGPGRPREIMCVLSRKET